jgi:hypothetical protein
MPEAPPIGIMPLKFWKEKCHSERVDSIIQAMYRYAKAEKPVPAEWIVELEELLSEQHVD